MDEPKYEAYVPPPPFAAPELRRAPIPVYRPEAGYPPETSYPPAAGYPAAPYDPGRWVADPAQPRHRPRRLRLVAGLLAVLAVVGLSTYWWSRGDGPHRLSIPAVLDGYERLTGPSAQQLESRMRSLGGSIGAGSTAPIFDAATIGLYAHDSGDQPVLIAFVVPTAQIPDAARAGSPDALARELVSGVGVDTQAFPPGPHGGATRCGIWSFATTGITVCSWSDAQTSGLLMNARENLAPGRLAGIERDLRAAIK